MAKKLEVNIQNIRNLETRTKKVEKDGVKKIVTAVKFECETPAGRFDNIHQALASNQPVDVLVASSQLAFEEPEEPGPD